MTQRGNFDLVAPFYDLMKRVVFGSAIKRSEAAYLDCLPSGCTLLIVGGGTGQILPLLLREKPRCRVWFVDTSEKMLKIAARRVPAEARHRITFIHGADPPKGVVFDAIITNFFLDVFTPENLTRIIGRLALCLAKDGVWLASDFVSNGSWWQRAMLAAMYRFFSATCRIDAQSLPAWEAPLRVAGLTEERSTFFFRNFIKSAVFRRRVESFAPGQGVS